MEIRENGYEIRIQHAENVRNSYLWYFPPNLSLFTVQYKFMQFLVCFGILANLVRTVQANHCESTKMNLKFGISAQKIWKIAICESVLEKKSIRD